MSKIDNMIKELELKKKKIEFFRHILDSAKSYENKNFKEVKDEVVDILEKFIDNTVLAIEEGADVNVASGISKEDIEIIKKVADRVKNRPIQNQPMEPAKKVNSQKPANPNPQSMTSAHDQMSFALSHRHLGGRQVKVADLNGEIVSGKVTGLDAPFVVVEVEGRGFLKIPPEKVITV